MTHLPPRAVHPGRRRKAAGRRSASVASSRTVAAAGQLPSSTLQHSLGRVVSVLRREHVVGLGARRGSGKSPGGRRQRADGVPGGDRPGYRRAGEAAEHREFLPLGRGGERGGGKGRVGESGVEGKGGKGDPACLGACFGWLGRAARKKQGGGGSPDSGVSQPPSGLIRRARSAVVGWALARTSARLPHAPQRLPTTSVDSDRP